MSTTTEARTLPLAAMSAVQEALLAVISKAVVAARRERLLINHLQAGIALMSEESGDDGGIPRKARSAWILQARKLIAITNQAYSRRSRRNARAFPAGCP